MNWTTGMSLNKQAITSCPVSHISGAHAEDWTRWRSLLYNLYDALIREISHIGSRGKYVTGMRHIAVKDNLIQLTADICLQVIEVKSQVCIQKITIVFGVIVYTAYLSYLAAIKCYKNDLSWHYFLNLLVFPACSCSVTTTTPMSWRWPRPPSEPPTWVVPPMEQPASDGALNWTGRSSGTICSLSLMTLKLYHGMKITTTHCI